MLDFQRLDVYRRALDLATLAHAIAGELQDTARAVADPLRDETRTPALEIARAAGHATRHEQATHYARARSATLATVVLLDILRTQQALSPARHEEAIELAASVLALIAKVAD